MGLGAVLVLAYLGLEWVSEVHEYNGLPVTAWNPGLGMLFAVMVLKPRLGAAILAIAMVLAEVLVVHSALDPRAISVMALLSAAAYAACSALARRGLGLDPAIPRLRDVGILLGVGAGATLLNAALLTLLLVALGSMGWADILNASLPFFIGDLIGIAIVTPLALRLWHAPAGRWRDRRQLAIGLAGIGLPMGLLLWMILRAGDPQALGYLYLLFLPVVGAALWLGLDGACASLALAQGMLILLLRLYGYDADAFTAFQSAMTVLGATGLLCGAVVTERDAAALAARDARARLAAREATAVRADRLSLATGMTSALSHEITQPITAARSLARAAQLRLPASDGAETTRLRENLAGIVAQIDHAADILGRMRNFVGRGTPERAPTTAAAIIDDTLALMRPRATRHGVTIETSCDPDLPRLSCDHVQIQQVLTNLIGNAIDAIAAAREPEAAAPVGRITVRAALSEDRASLLFRVRDDGPGIPPALAPRVFDLLTTAKPEGLGLGLSICALIVEAHGGRIWLEETRPGGTEFRFWLPITAMEPAMEKDT